MDAHHLIRMDKSSRIDKYMSDNRSCMGIFFEDECEYSTWSKLFAILKCISSYDTDRVLIAVERIECELESIACDLRDCDIDDLSRSEYYILLLEAVAWRCLREYWIGWSDSARSFDHVDRVDISSSSCRDREPRRGILQCEFSDLTLITLRWEELEEATLVEKYWILHCIANIRDNISCRVYKWKSKCLKHDPKELYIKSHLEEYPSGKMIFLTLDESHIRECRIGLSGILYVRVSCTDEKRHITSAYEHERIRKYRCWEEYKSEYIRWEWWKICRLHRGHKSRETRYEWEWSRGCHRTHYSARTRSIVTCRCMTRAGTLTTWAISVLNLLWKYVFRYAWSWSTDRTSRRQSYTESDIICITKNTSHRNGRKRIETSNISRIVTNKRVYMDS